MCGLKNFLSLAKGRMRDRRTNVRRKRKLCLNWMDSCWKKKDLQEQKYFLW